MMDEKILKIQHTLKKELDENRYHHTLGVMYTSASMAMRYDVDVQKALYAGLLHDCAGKSKSVTCQTRCVSGS